MLTQVPKYAFGANLKQLKIRMKSVESIKKITKAMKMISATKMRMEVKRLEAGENFATGEVQKIIENETYIQRKKPELQAKKTLLVPMTTDKGLCGGCNSGIVRDLKQTILQGDRSGYQIFCIGSKGEVALTRPFPDLLKRSIIRPGNPTTWPQANSIGYQVALYASESGCDNITLVYNYFKNAVSSIITHTNVMPREFFLKHFKYLVRHEAVEPDLEYSKHYFFELYLGSIFYNSFLHSNASEQSQRMSAMENASKNAGEMLDKLTLQYNQARQAKITTELIEVISGAEAAVSA